MKPGPGIPNPGFYATCQLALTYGTMRVSSTRAYSSTKFPALQDRSPPVRSGPFHVAAGKKSMIHRGIGTGSEPANGGVMAMTPSETGKLYSPHQCDLDTEAPNKNKGGQRTEGRGSGPPYGHLIASSHSLSCSTYAVREHGAVLCLKKNKG